MTDAAARLAPWFFQIAWVVRDIAAAEAFFTGTLGVRKFTRLSNVTLGEGCEYRGRPADSVAHLSLGYLGDTQVELIESVRGESLYSEFLAARGPGLHHVAFSVPDFDATVAALEGDGLTVSSRGAIGAGTRFAYFDCEGPGYSTIEILGFDDATRGFMEALREQGQWV